MSFARSVVEIVDDLIAAYLGDGTHAAALGQILTQQPVEIFIAAAFPGVVRRREVNLDREALFESSVVVELGAVVEGDGLELSAVTADGSCGRSRNVLHLACLQLLDDRVAGLALN